MPEYRVQVEERLCKSCGICIAFCARGVLQAEGALRKAVPVHAERCTGCRLCEIYCPDWAISVEPSAPHAQPETSPRDQGANVPPVQRAGSDGQ